MLNPLLWAMVLLLAGLGFRNRQIKNRFCWAALAILVFFSNPFMSKQVSEIWEHEIRTAREVELGQRPVVLLGGMAESWPGMDRPIFLKGGDRLIGALELLQHSEQNMLLISGGAFYKRDVLPEASFIKSFLTNQDMIPNPIVAESTSTNTAQNARYCREIFTRHDWPMDIVLVSSAFHLYRARKCFEKQGFQVETFATDPLESRTPKPIIHAFIPNLQSLITWEYLFKEWLGTLYYYLKGEI
ncbi:YdcF family protein [Echinicola rosea]|nr:YdcF family protein [Echinicola rosea]